jgi:hypothetical protein
LDENMPHTKFKIQSYRKTGKKLKKMGGGGLSKGAN